MSVTGSRYLLGTSASKIFIVGIGKSIGIASASPAGSRRLALRIACEAAFRVACIIVKAVCCGGVIDLSTLAADPGVALKANAENATADAVAILRIVFITLSNKFGALVYFEMSPVVINVGRLAMKSLCAGRH